MTFEKLIKHFNILDNAGEFSSMQSYNKSEV